MRDQVFTEVMGPDGHGYVRTYGHGPSPADLLRENSRRNYELVKEELSRLQSNYDDLQCKYTDLQGKYDEMYSFMQRYFDGFAAEIHTSASEQVLSFHMHKPKLFVYFYFRKRLLNKLGIWVVELRLWELLDGFRVSFIKDLLGRIIVLLFSDFTAILYFLFIFNSMKLQILKSCWLFAFEF